VEPQIIVPMEAEAEQKVMMQQWERELFKKPKGAEGAPATAPAPEPQAEPAPQPQPPLQPQPPPGQEPEPGSSPEGAAPVPPTTAPTTAPSTQPAQPIDVQLEQAVKTLIGHIVLRGQRAGK
jgi:hypothetical protein